MFRGLCCNTLKVKVTVGRRYICKLQYCSARLTLIAAEGPVFLSSAAETPTSAGLVPYTVNPIHPKTIATKKKIEESQKRRAFIAVDLGVYLAIPP